MQTKTGVIYLQKEKFQVYSPYLPNILEFRFVPELIHDFDLINKDLLENLMKVFIVNNKIPASGLIMVIADNASFIKDFLLSPAHSTPGQPPSAPPTLEDLQEAANQYLEHIPFEVVASKTFPLANGVKAYATNQEIYEAIKSVLEKHGFILQGVIPGFAFGAQVGNLASIDGPTVALILQKVSMVRAFNLLKDDGSLSQPTIEESSLTQKDDTESSETVPDEPPAKDNKKLIMAISISAIVLIFVITGFILYSQFANPPYKPQPVTAHPAAAAAVAPTTAVVPSTPSSGQSLTPADPKDLTAQIISATSSAEKATAIQTAFTPHGFKSVTMQTQDTLSTAQGLVIFSPRVGADVRTEVVADAKKVLGDVLIQDKADASFDIVVILGK